MKRYLLAVLSLLLCINLSAQKNGRSITGEVMNAEGEPMGAVKVSVRELNKQTLTDNNGNFSFTGLYSGRYHVEVEMRGYVKEVVHADLRVQKSIALTIMLAGENEHLDDVEVFGERNRRPKGLETITRMPLKPSDQIQTISIISHKLIKDQGALTLTDAVRNIPGVTLFGSYGGVKESMSTRGFRGVPVLKNGVRIDGQFQTASGVVDMQGVESIQMIKGAAAITQGVITDLGNAGGVLNVVTKTPNFVNAGEIGIRAGSWGQFRPTFDIETVLDRKKTVSFRINGAYERADSYRSYVKSNRVYINPSFAWKPGEDTKIILEGDFLNDNRTPQTSAVNLHPLQSENALYILPYNKFLGMSTDNNNTKTGSITARLEHRLSDQLSVRALYASSLYEVDDQSTSATLIKDADNKYNTFARRMSRSLRNDKNKVFQVDFIGQELYTGRVKHTAQAGFDYRISDVFTTTYAGKLSPLGKNIPFGAANAANIDTINIFNDYANDLERVVYKDDNGQLQTGKSIVFTEGNKVPAYYSTFGILVQDVIEFNKYVKLALGLRYSEIITKSFTSNKHTWGSAWNPSAGIIVSPLENVNLFASYTNSTSLRSEANLMSNGEKIGPSTTEQIEGGIKSDWLDNRLRFNLTYFHIFTTNLSNTEYVPGTNQATGYYYKAGDLLRDGIETELNGRVMPNLTVVLGYAYLNARYKNSPSYVNGSAPMNAPKHTANGWVQYLVDKGALNGLSMSVGAYYVGERPINEYSLQPDAHGNNAGVEPFNMPAYYTLNVQLGYRIRNWDLKVYMNNLTDQVGLNSYFRGGYINQIDPKNFAAAISYRF